MSRWSHPVDYTGLKPVTTNIKGIDPGPPVRVMTYRDSVGHELSELDRYRYGQSLEQSGKWTEAEELTARLDAQMALDPELVLTYDMLGQNPSYQPR